MQTREWRNRHAARTWRNDLTYIIEAIGSQFSNNDLPRLAERFNQQAASGNKFHSVFQVTQPGCLGIGQGTVTYLAVYVSED